MPTVPRLTNTQVAPTPFRPVERAGPQGPNAFQSLGRAGLHVADVVDEVDQMERAKADRASVLEADRTQGELENTLLFDPQNGAYNKQGKNALGVRQAVLSDLDKKASETADGLTSSRAKLIFQQAWSERRQRVDRDLARHEGQEQQRYQDDQASASVKLTKEDAALRWNQPAAIAEALSKQRTLIGQQASRHGWSEEQTNAAIADAAEDTHTGVLRGMLSAQDFTGARKYLDDNRGSFSPAMQQQADKAITAARVEGISSDIATRFRTSISAGDKALGGLDKLGLSEAEQNDVRAKVRTNIGILYDERSRQYASQTAALGRSIAKDDPPANAEGEAHRLYQLGAYTPSQYTSVLEGIDRSRVERAKSTAAADELNNALGSGLPLDPNSKVQRDALSGMFNQQTVGMKVGSDPWQATAVALAGRTRILPDQATQWVRQSLRSPDFGQAAKAAQFYGAVQASAPDAVSSFDQDSKAFAGMVSSMVDAGTDPLKAAETARAIVFDANPRVIENRKKRYNTGSDAIGKGSDSALTAFIDRDFDTWRTTQPTASAEMGVDFNRLSENYYLKTGDVDTARDLAWKDLTRVYGVTQINGERMMMPLPPEKFGVTREMVNADLSSFLAAHPQGDTKPGEMMLVPDSLTLRTLSSALDGKAVNPSYRIIKKDGDLLTDSNGSPVRYVLPSAEDLSGKIEAAQKAAADAQIASAKQQRDFLQSQAAEIGNRERLP